MGVYDMTIMNYRRTAMGEAHTMVSAVCQQQTRLRYDLYISHAILHQCQPSMKQEKSYLQPRKTDQQERVSKQPAVALQSGFYCVLVNSFILIPQKHLTRQGSFFRGLKYLQTSTSIYFSFILTNLDR